MPLFLILSFIFSGLVFKIFTFKLRSPHVWYAIFSLMEHVHLILQEILIQSIIVLVGLKFKYQNAFKAIQDGPF